MFCLFCSLFSLFSCFPVILWSQVLNIKVTSGKACVQAARDALAESRLLVVDRCNCTRLQRRVPRLTKRGWPDFSNDTVTETWNLGLAGACKRLRSWSSDPAEIKQHFPMFIPHGFALGFSLVSVHPSTSQNPRLAFGSTFQRQRVLSLTIGHWLKKTRLWHVSQETCGERVLQRFGHRTLPPEDKSLEALPWHLHVFDSIDLAQCINGIHFAGHQWLCATLWSANGGLVDPGGAKRLTIAISKSSRPRALSDGESKMMAIWRRCNIIISFGRVEKLPMSETF